MEKYDIIVCGASTTGAWFAKTMAKKGFRVLVIEKQQADDVSREYDIFHMESKEMKRFGLTIPQDGDKDYEFNFYSGCNRSPYGNYPKTGRNHIIGMHKHDYIMRMNDEAKQAGATIIYSAAFKDFLLDENGRRIGAKYAIGDEIVDVEAKLVADCTGIPAAARTKLPDTSCVENFPLTPRDIFYVVLYYAKYEDQNVVPDDLYSSFLNYKAWSAPSGDAHGAILGIGGNYGYDYAEEIFKDFVKNVPWPKYTVEKVEKGMTPYHRGIYCTTDDGFVALGDTACLTKPTCGEGCTSSLYHAEIAAEVIGDLLAAGKELTKENMWQINKRYIKVQGKDFDTLRPLLIGLVSANYDEAEYLFKNDVIFSQSILGGMGEDLNFTPTEIAKMVKVLIGGVLTGKLRAGLITNIIKALKQSGDLGKLMDEFPDTYSGYTEWKAKADALWDEIGSIADSCNTEILEKLGYN